MIIIYFLSFYFIVGLLFAIWFSFYKVQKIDEGAAKTSLWFKLIIMPATVLLWPIILKKILMLTK